jgi:hypothetical protein
MNLSRWLEEQSNIFYYKLALKSFKDVFTVRPSVFTTEELFFFKLFELFQCPILDIIQRPLFYLKHDVSETVFCLRLHVEPTPMCPIERASLCFRNTTNSVAVVRRQKVALSLGPT